jgi:hypothetical protein
MPGTMHYGGIRSLGFGRSDADRGLWHWLAGDFIVDHHALTVAVQTEIDSLLAVLHADSQRIFCKRAGAAKDGYEDQAAVDSVHDFFSRFVSFCVGETLRFEKVAAR